MNNDTGIVRLHGRDYKTVALRVSEFRARYPIEGGWGICTEILSEVDGTITMMAKVTGVEEGTPTPRVLATGYAREDVKALGKRGGAALEICETSAIGRALAAAGFGGSEYASADELAGKMAQQNPQPGEATDAGKGVAERVDDARRASHHPSFDRAERVRFMMALGGLGYRYDPDIVDYCNNHGWGPPSQWTSEHRSQFLVDLRDENLPEMPPKTERKR